MTKRIKFTQNRVRDIPTPEARENGKEVRATYYDTETPKLNIRVSSSGAKTYYVTKKNREGKTRFVRVGPISDITVDQARIQATNILSQLNQGSDPTEEKRKQRVRSLSLEALVEQYIDEHPLKPRSIRDYRDKIKWGFSDWLTKSASSITEKMVLARHKKLSKKGKTSTNDAFVRLRAILNYGHAIGATPSQNPVTILSNARLWHKRNQRKEIIASHQLKEWLDAVNQVTPEIHRTAFLLMLYMGFRISETYSLEWKDIDLDNELITQRDTKNGTDHELPIPLTLLPLMHTLKEATGNRRYLFPSPASKDNKSRTNHETPYSYPKKVIKQINDRISFHFSPHMSRHTFTTIAEAVNIPKTMIDRLTNHTTTNDVTGGYIHTETETLRIAINKIASYISNKTSTSDNVVRLYRQ